ncbi:hypothetical protein ABIB85_008225 [Bradyrhizobium sp. JR1.5]
MKQSDRQLRIAARLVLRHLNPPQRERQLAVLEIPIRKRREPIRRGLVMELDHLVAIDGLRGILPAEDAAGPTDAVPALIGELFWRRDKLDTRELAAVGDRERTFSGPLTVE